MGDVYRRSGRGGAGNFYSQKDVAEIEERAAAEAKNDLEAQKSSSYNNNNNNNYDEEPPSDPADPPRTAAISSDSKQPQAYARSGRGGAGNFVDASTAVPVDPAATSTPTSTSTSTSNPTTTSAAAAATPRTAGLSGRGGAGNWATTTTTPTTTTTTGVVGSGAWVDLQARKRERQDALDRSLQEALPRPPERIYHLHGRGGRAAAGRGRVRAQELEDV